MDFSNVDILNEKRLKLPTLKILKGAKLKKNHSIEVDAFAKAARSPHLKSRRPILREQ